MLIAGILILLIILGGKALSTAVLFGLYVYGVILAFGAHPIMGLIFFLVPPIPVASALVSLWQGKDVHPGILASFRQLRQ
jgi:hypothetical protein